MQVYYIDNHIDIDRMIAKQRADMVEQIEPLTRSIINTRLKSKKECGEYMKKLAVDIIAYYALGNPENGQVSQIVYVTFFWCCYFDFSSKQNIICS